MKATIWHNPNCGTSRNTLAALQARGDIDLTVVEYLKNPPSREKLAQLYRDAGLTDLAAQALRKVATPDTKTIEALTKFLGVPAERGLTTAGDDAVLDAMAADPILIERPLVETEKGVRLCRPAEKVDEIL